MELNGPRRTRSVAIERGVRPAGLDLKPDLLLRASADHTSAFEVIRPAEVVHPVEVQQEVLACHPQVASPLGQQFGARAPTDSLDTTSARDRLNSNCGSIKAVRSFPLSLPVVDCILQTLSNRQAPLADPHASQQDPQ